jgi:hypothetical protein
MTLLKLNALEKKSWQGARLRHRPPCIPKEPHSEILAFD